MNGGPALETVEIVDEECVVERGTATVNWFVHYNDGWIHVSEWPDALSERLDASAGTVWRSRTELRVPRGTELLRVESRPGRYNRANPLDYLTRAPTGPGRNVTRTYYRVGRGGTLLPAASH